MSIRLIWRVLVCVMVLVPWLQLKCQTTAAGARSASLAGVSAGLEDAWAVANNPAGLARYNHISLATNAEQRYLMKELGYYAIAASIPAGKGCLGIFTIFSGYQAFIDQKVSLGYGRQFGEHVLTGISLVYVFQKAGGEAPPLHQVSYELGTIIVLSKKVNLAFATFNPFQLYYKSKDNATLPAILKLGMSFQYSPALFIHAECEKDLDLSPCLKIGMEYIFRDIFFIRGGIRIFPASYSFGTGLRHNRLLFEFSSAYHQYLGFTPQISLQYDIK
ncbi:MAG: hypothetical protein M0Q51_07995 [Bacteroidales bacterium]|nr:hypothetical protein [Bacteroidales bacterium]